MAGGNGGSNMALALIVCTLIVLIIVGFFAWGGFDAMFGGGTQGLRF